MEICQKGFYYDGTKNNKGSANESAAKDHTVSAGAYRHGLLYAIQGHCNSSMLSFFNMQG